MTYLFYPTFIGSLILAWYFYDWPLALIILLVYLAILFYWLGLKFNLIKERLERGESIEEIHKDMAKHG